MALVLDYKSGKRSTATRSASWENENRFQVALYMLVVERLLGLQAAGGVYVPLGSDDRSPRGHGGERRGRAGLRLVARPRREPDEFDAMLGLGARAGARD